MTADGAIWLVGLMGAGKSTVGRLLAERLGRAFVDLDDEIAREAGRSIPEIFEAEGEAGFRRREREALERAGRTSHVVALGGGAISQPGIASRNADRPSPSTRVWRRWTRRRVSLATSWRAAALAYTSRGSGWP